MVTPHPRPSLISELSHASAQPRGAVRFPPFVSLPVPLVLLDVVGDAEAGADDDAADLRAVQDPAHGDVGDGDLVAVCDGAQARQQVLEERPAAKRPNERQVLAEARRRELGLGGLGAAQIATLPEPRKRVGARQHVQTGGRGMGAGGRPGTDRSDRKPPSRVP